MIFKIREIEQAFGDGKKNGPRCEENEMAIIDTIKDIKDVTVIIISHNKSALVNCNKIIKIKDGELM